jgi:hypothetical protein
MILHLLRIKGTLYDHTFTWNKEYYMSLRFLGIKKHFIILR